jgi:DNA-binding LytR/AlgR family response regulator
MIKCIAVDDEKLVLDLLVDNIQKIPFLQLEKRCRNAWEASEILHQEKIDLIFLDIQMPGLDGLQFLESLHNPPLVIFVTAFREYAVEGFNLNAVDYLLKPVSFERFFKACNKAYELFNLHHKPATPDTSKDFFFVYVEYNQVKINIGEILYIEGMKDYVKIFTNQGTRPVITKISMKALEEKLIGHRFARIHKSYIVSADKVTAVKRDLVCIGTAELPLSENYKDIIGQLLSL